MQIKAQSQFIRYTSEDQLTDKQISFLKKRAPIRGVPNTIRHEINHFLIEDRHAWVEMGDSNGPAVIFSHGLMGNLFNAASFFTYLAKRGYRMIFPFLPMYDMPLGETNVSGLGNYIDSFIRDLQLTRLVLIGNSTGGGASVYWASRNLPVLKGLILIGSSGISNRSLENTSIRRNDWNFMFENMKSIVRNKQTVKREMIDDVFQATKDYEMAIRILRLTRSVMKEKLEHEASGIQAPTLLCWGMYDIVTPPSGAEVFHQLIQGSSLCWFKNCGHLPQMERPRTFCKEVLNFFNRIDFHPKKSLK